TFSVDTYSRAMTGGTGVGSSALLRTTRVSQLMTSFNRSRTSTLACLVPWAIDVAVRSAATSRARISEATEGEERVNWGAGSASMRGDATWLPATWKGE